MATKNVYEQAKLKIKVKLKDQSRKTNDTAQLQLFKNDNPVGTVTLAVKKQWVEHTHTFDDVGDNDDNYRFKYVVTHDTETLRGTDDYVVWPLTTNVTLLNDADGSPLADTAFDLEFTTHGVSHFRSGTDGKCLCKLKEKALFWIPILPHLVFVRWDTGGEHGRHRKARVLIVRFKATITAPVIAAPETDAIVQYVNVAPGNTGDTLGHDRRGPKVVIAMKLVDGIDPARAVNPPIGQHVYLRVALSDATKRTARTPTLVGATDLDTRTRNLLKGKVFSVAGGTAKVTLQLGMGGKEKYELKVGTTPDCADATLKFESRRKLWVQTIAAAGSAPAFDDAVGALKKVGIELLRDPDVVVAGGGAPAGSMIAGANFGLPNAQLVVGDHNVGQFTAMWTKPSDPLCAYGIFCDYQFDGGAGAALTASAAYDINDAMTVAWPPTGATVKGFAARPVQSKHKKATLLSHCVHTGNVSVTGRWTSNAAAPPHQGAGDAIPADHFHVDWNGTPGRLWVKLPAAASAVTADGETVSVEVDVTYVLGPYNGWAPSNPLGGVVVAVRNRSGARSANGMNQTLVHEIGHLLKQVDTPSAGIALTRTGDHGLFYTGRGHSGGHCAFGIPKSVYKGGGDLTGQALATCVMYGEGSSTRGIDYCVKCAPFVLAEPMETLV